MPRCENLLIVLRSLVIKLLYYLIKRFFLIIPTLLGIVTINFFIINYAPGGPLDQIKAQIKADQILTTETTELIHHQITSFDEQTINKLKKDFGFDKPMLSRYLELIKNYLCFSFGKSYYKGKPVIDMVKQALPVSLSITVSSLFIIFITSIILGITQAFKTGVIDWGITLIVALSYAIPGFIFALWLLILFAGGSFFNWFPIRGLTSDHAYAMNLPQKILDHIWHLVLPVTSIVLGHFAKTTLLTKNSVVDEIGKLYIVAVRAKGASEKYVLIKHCFRNALLTIFGSVPYMFLTIFFYTTLMIEFVFSLNGFGYLGYEAIVTRDYPVMFATLYLFSLTSLVLLLLFDMIYCYIDPRISFDK